jgi:hypothetical protein
VPRFEVHAGVVRVDQRWMDLVEGCVRVRMRGPRPLVVRTARAAFRIVVEQRVEVVEVQVGAGVERGRVVEGLRAGHGRHL